MALNATIFPAFGAASRTPDFARGPGHPGDGMAAYRAALDALVDTADWRTAGRRVVVAHSFGGMLALSWLLAHGGTGDPPIHGLVLISTTAGPMYQAAGLRLPGGWRLPTAPLMPLWDSRLASVLAKAVLGLGRQAQVDFLRYRGRSELAVGLAGWRLTTVAGRRAYRAAMLGFDVREQLGAIRVPAVVLHGTRDTYFDLEAARALASGLRADLRVIAGARHVLPLSHPEVVQAAVTDLIADRSPRY